MPKAQVRKMTMPHYHRNRNDKSCSPIDDNSPFRDSEDKQKVGGLIIQNGQRVKTQSRSKKADTATFVTATHSENELKGDVDRDFTSTLAKTDYRASQKHMYAR